MQDIYDIFSSLFGTKKYCKGEEEGPPEIEFPNPYEWVAEERAKDTIVELLPERAGQVAEVGLTVANGAATLGKGLCVCVPYRNRIANAIDGDFSYELRGN
jgi:hypothetical protein